MTAVERAQRLARMRELLEHGRLTTLELAELLNVADRTVRADLVVLQSGPLYTPIATIACHTIIRPPERT